MRDWLERAGNLAHALRRRRADDDRMRWSRDRLRAYQQQRLRALVHHATRHAPFYRELYGGVVDRDVELTELPTVTKDALMARFDDAVTDRRLRLVDLARHVEQVRGDDRYLGEFRVMASSGSSGRKAIYVYDRAAWRDGFLPAGLRMSGLIGLRPGYPRPRLATLAAPDGKHMTFRGGASLDVGLYVTRRIAADQPLEAIVAELQAYRPDFVMAYPSMLAMVAEEQRAGRLRIAPKMIVTSSEVRTLAMTAAIRGAWGVEPFDCLGLTETGVTAVDCHEHRGLHVFEDFVIVEVVDGKVLVTNLYNRTQPIIRFEVSDLITIDDRPCPCGITFARIVALDGRSDDILDLGGVKVHPIHLRSALGAEPMVLQYQVVQERDRLDVQVVLAAGAPTATCAHLVRALELSLRERGADVPVTVRVVDAIPREAGPGKLKLVRAAQR